ncbi:MAG: synthase [Patescibacteria group bacterium]|nr:synthase [Patescibacteria group bacterium]
MLKSENPDDVLFVLVSYLPTPSTIGEMKTKPTQYAARTLNAAGIQPDFIIARATRPLDEKRKEKIAVFCNVRKEAVISAPDVDSIYDVPVNFEKDGLSKAILKKLDLRSRKDSLHEWADYVDTIHEMKKTVKIAVIGKYFKTGDFVLADAYISVIEALKHASYAVGRKPELHWIGSEEFEKDPTKLTMLEEFDGVLVPGGFGGRGIEGIISTIEFCRKKKIPYFGLCYGMQLMVIEYARNVLGRTGANTTEVDEQSKHPIIDIMPEQKENLKKRNFGATMRLGDYEARLKKGTIAYEAYGKKDSVTERHRHRYEVNPEYVAELEKAGLIFSGVSPSGMLMEIAELPKSVHPFFLASQFHPEFQSSLFHPNPLFIAFLKACSKGKK